MSSKELLSHKSKRIIGDAIKFYGLGPNFTAKKIKTGYTNKNYKITSENKDYLLKIHRDKNPENLKYEIAVVNELNKEGLPVRNYLKRLDNNYFTLTPHGYVSVSEYIQGKQPEINEKTVIQVAQLLGKLHNVKLPKELERENPWGIPLIEKTYLSIKQGDFFPELTAPFIQHAQSISNNLINELPRGLIHGDLFADNVVFKHGKLVGILDFEAACQDVFVYDIGVALNGFCFNNDNTLNFSLLRQFLENYDMHRKIEYSEYESIPVFIKIGTLSMVAYHLDSLSRVYKRKNHYRATRLLERVDRLI
jgi:homoserine kinase type II